MRHPLTCLCPCRTPGLSPRCIRCLPAAPVSPSVPWAAGPSRWRRSSPSEHGRPQHCRKRVDRWKITKWKERGSEDALVFCLVIHKKEEPNKANCAIYKLASNTQVGYRGNTYTFSHLSSIEAVKRMRPFPPSVSRLTMSYSTTFLQFSRDQWCESSSGCASCHDA